MRWILLQHHDGTSSLKNRGHRVEGRWRSKLKKHSMQPLFLMTAWYCCCYCYKERAGKGKLACPILLSCPQLSLPVQHLYTDLTLLCTDLTLLCSPTDFTLLYTNLTLLYTNITLLHSLTDLTLLFSSTDLTQHTIPYQSWSTNLTHPFNKSFISAGSPLLGNQ